MASLLALVDERGELTLQPVLEGGHIAQGTEFLEPLCRGRMMSHQFTTRRRAHRAHVRRQCLDVAELCLHELELLPLRLINAALTISNEAALRDATQIRFDVRDSAFPKGEWISLRHSDHG